MNIKTVWLLVVGLVLSLVCPATSWADEPTAEARAQAKRLHEEGLSHYATGDYSRAVEAYRQAYLLVPAPGILFNLGHALRLGGDCAAALQAYKTYLRQSAQDSSKSVVEEHIANMERCVAAGRSRPLAAHTAAAGPSPSGPVGTPAHAPSGRGKTLRILGVSAAATGVLVGGLGVYFGLQARSASSELDRFNETGGVWGDEQVELEARGERDDKLFVALSITGGALVVTGLVLYLGNRDSSAEAPALAIVPTEGGGVVAWGMSF